MAVYTTINDPSAYFQTKIYTGTGSSNAITNDGNSDLQPDWIWGKARNQTYNHNVFDTNRGLTKRLTTDQADAENTDSTTITSSDSDGFTLGTSSNLNGSSVNYVAWQWKANGGTTASNASGSITSTTQANTTAGFSIVTYTGNGVNGATVGHSLGAVPQLIMVKRSDSAANWMVYHEATGQTKATFLDLTAAADTDAGYWSNTAPTTGIFNLGTNTKGNASGGTYVAYCFAEKQGYSKFGSYTGNGSADGAFIYTGFKPAFTMIKNTQTAGYNWIIQDTKRFDGVNSGAGDKNLAANSNSAEPSSASFSGNQIDYLSNGFKLRSSAANTNAAQSYIYMAFAENPFVTSDSVPATAR